MAEKRTQNHEIKIKSIEELTNETHRIKVLPGSVIPEGYTYNEDTKTAEAPLVRKVEGKLILIKGALIPDGYKQIGEADNGVVIVKKTSNTEISASAIAARLQNTEKPWGV